MTIESRRSGIDGFIHEGENSKIMVECCERVVEEGIRKWDDWTVW